MLNFLIKRRAFRLVPPDGGLLAAICRRPEIDNDLISGVAVDNVDVDVHIHSVMCIVTAWCKISFDTILDLLYV